MPLAALEVEIINKVTNIGAFMEEKAAMQSAFGGGVGGASAGGLFLGAPGSGAAVEKEAKQAGVSFKEYETNLKNATIAAGEAGSITDGLARKMNALGQLGFTPASVALIGVVAGAGALYEVSKSIIDISEKEQIAQKDLAQAYAVLGEKIPNKMLQDFIDKNEKFLPGIAQTEEGFAALARAGFNDTMQLRLMNDATDLAAVKGWTLSIAVDTLIKAHGGNAKALADLGVTQKEANALVAKGSDENTKYLELLSLLEPKLVKARENTSNLHQSQSELNIEWEKFATKVGPSASDTFITIQRGVEGVIGALSAQIDLVTRLNAAWTNFNSGNQTSARNPRQRGFNVNP